MKLVVTNTTANSMLSFSKETLSPGESVAVYVSDEVYEGEIVAGEEAQVAMMAEINAYVNAGFASVSPVASDVVIRRILDEDGNVLIDKTGGSSAIPVTMSSGGVMSQLQVDALLSLYNQLKAGL